MPAARQLPEAVQALYDGRDLPSKIGVTALLASSAAEGSPHLAMLSAGEILALDRSGLRLALHSRSGSTQALRHTGKALLLVVVDNVAYRIRLQLHEVESPPGAEPLHPPTTYFRAEVLETHRDEAPYARLTSGITFELVDSATTLSAWEAKLEALRAI